MCGSRPGPPHKLNGVHVVEVGQLANDVGTWLAASPLNLGEVGAGNADALGHVPQAEVSPQPSEKGAYGVVALDLAALVQVSVVVKFVHVVSHLNP